MAAALFIFGVFFIFWLWFRGKDPGFIDPHSEPGTVLSAADDSGESFNIQAHICTCRDWQHRRSRFMFGKPMRLCVHLTAYFARNNNALPLELHVYAPLIVRQAQQYKGMPCGRGTEYGHLENNGYVLYIEETENGSQQAQLLLGRQFYSHALPRGIWQPENPPQVLYFNTRARQLANMGKG